MMRTLSNHLALIMLCLICSCGNSEGERSKGGSLQEEGGDQGATLVEIFATRNPEPHGHPISRDNENVIGRFFGSSDRFTFVSGVDNVVKSGALNLRYNQRGYFEEISGFNADTSTGGVVFDTLISFPVVSLAGNASAGDFYDGVGWAWGYHSAPSGAESIEPIMIQVSPVKDRFVLFNMTATKESLGEGRVKVALNLKARRNSIATVAQPVLFTHSIQDNSFRSRVVVAYLNGAGELKGEVGYLDDHDLELLNGFDSNNRPNSLDSNYDVNELTVEMDDLGQNPRYATATIMLWGYTGEGDSRRVCLCVESAVLK